MRYFLSDFPFPNCTVFPDTNIWLFNYGLGAISTVNKYKARQYNKFLQECKTNKLQIVIDQTVIGEFYHKIISEAYKIEKARRSQANEDTISWKEFRNTNEFKAAHSDAIADIISILTYVDEVVTDTSETNGSLIKRLGELLRNPVDFNDFRIENQALRHECWILTDDFDFDFSDANIISFNTDLCPRT